MKDIDLKTKKILVIVESPNKTAHISEYLKKAGYNVKVMASVGHIMELANESGSYYNTGIRPEKDFAMNIKVAAEKKDKVTQLQAQVNWADIVYLMTDPDREGFVIAWSLIKFLKLPKGKYVRAITHEITPKAVINAIENPIPMDDNLVDAGLARLCLDKMIGYRLSPIAKTYIGAKSVGRCQSAGLKLIAEREDEITSFIPETYFDIYLHFSKNKTDFKARYVGTVDGQIEHLKTQKDVDAVIKACKGKYIIEGVAKKEKQESPKPPFCTATFQQEASSKLGLSVKDAMSCAQKNFEAGRISYHRTDDTTMSPEFIPMLKTYITNTYGKTAYTAPRLGKKQEGAQEGHECLRVTDPSLTPEKLAETEPNSLLVKVYKLIWQRTVASAMPNAIISETGYLIDNSGQKFLLTSNEVVDDGYRKVYSYKDDEEADEGGVVKETFKKGEELKNTDLETSKKETKPKPRFTEATFIKELQKREIGRPSTYATIVETVLSPTRNYCKLDGKSITPTDTGMQLIRFLDRSFSNIINLDYTKEMEKELDNIATGKLTKTKFLTEFYDTMEKTIKESPETGKAAEAPSCPKCGAPMIMRRSRYGKLFYGCSAWPKCNGIVNVK